MTTIRKIIIEPAPAQARQAHSPLPWDVGDSRMIYDADAREAAVPYGQTDEQVDTNAAFIVRACNNVERLAQALVECRDILCALNTSDSVTKLAYMKPRDIPAAIKSAYQVLQDFGALNTQKGGQ